MYKRTALSVLIAYGIVFCFPNLFGQVPASAGRERLVTEGILVAVQGDFLTLRNDHGTVVFFVNGGTAIWRGGAAKLQELRPGDDLDVAYYTSKGSTEKVATEIDANIANWSGTIAKIVGKSLTIARQDEQGNAWGTVTILLGDKTEFLNGAATDLKVGASLQAVGLDLGQHRMRATTILTILPPPAK